MDLKQELSNLPESWIVLITSPAEEITKINIDILRIITGGGIMGVYITVNRPYKTLIKHLERNGVDPYKFFFIDCITKTAGGRAERAENCLFVASPNSLTELGIALTQAIQMIPGNEKFIFMDTLSTLLIYNSAGTTAKFSHFLITRIKLLGLKGIFMSVENELDERLLSQIEQFCDKCIHIS